MHKKKIQHNNCDHLYQIFKAETCADKITNSAVKILNAFDILPNITFTLIYNTFYRIFKLK